MIKFLTQKSVWLLVMALAVSFMCVTACTDEESKSISAIGASDPIQPKGSVQGIVRDICTGEAKSGVKVTMAYSGSLHEFWTNSSGLYAFNDVPVNTSNGSGTTFIPNMGDTALTDDNTWVNPGDYYTVVADFSNYLDEKINRGEDVSEDYNRTYIGYVQLTYESMHDGMGDMAMYAQFFTNLTVTGSGAATPVEGLAGGLDILVSKKNAAIEIQAVRLCSDMSDLPAATFGLYGAYGDDDDSNAFVVGDKDDVFIQRIDWTGTGAVNIDGLEGGRVYYLRVLDEELAFFYYQNGTLTPNVPTSAGAFFGGNTNDLTASSVSLYNDPTAFMVHCNETAYIDCITLCPAPCMDVVSPWIIDYEPMYLSEAADCNEISVTFSERMDTDYPPVDSNPEEFVAVIVVDYRSGSNSDYGNSGVVYTPISLTAEWTNGGTTLEITPGTQIPTGARVLVVLRDGFFRDVNGNPLLEEMTNTDGNTANDLTGLEAPAAMLYREYPEPATHTNTSMVSMYSWVGAGATAGEIDWVYYCPCDEDTSIVANLIQSDEFVWNSTSPAHDAGDPITDTWVALDWDRATYDVTSTLSDTVCDLAYRIYVSTGDDPDCEFGILLAEVTTPAGNPTTSFECALTTVQATGVISWTDFGGAADRIFTMGVAPVNCNNEEGTMLTIVVQSVTPICIDKSGFMSITSSNYDWGFQTAGNYEYNNLRLTCEPPAGYLQIDLTKVMDAVSAESIANQNFVIISGYTDATQCELNNTKDPDLAFQSFVVGDPGDGSTDNVLTLEANNMWWADDFDILSIGGTAYDGTDGVLDLLGNITQGATCSTIMINDEIGPVVAPATVTMDPGEFEESIGDEDTEDYDKLVVTFIEELSILQGTNGKWTVGGTALSALGATWGNSGDINGSELMADTTFTTRYNSALPKDELISTGGVTEWYPKASYSDTTGYTTLTFYFADGTFDSLVEGDSVRLGVYSGAVPPDGTGALAQVGSMDIAGNAQIWNDGITNELGDNTPQAAIDIVATWNDLADGDNQPKLGGPMDYSYPGNQVRDGVCDATWPATNLAPLTGWTIGDWQAAGDGLFDASAWTVGASDLNGNGTSVDKHVIHVCFSEYVNLEDIDIDLDINTAGCVASITDWAPGQGNGQYEARSLELFIEVTFGAATVPLAAGDAIELSDITGCDDGLEISENADELVATAAQPDID